MKYGLIFCLFFYINFTAKAQYENGAGYLGLPSPNIPISNTYTSSSIAQFIQSAYTTEPEKLYAIYAWVITNIKYDKDSMYPINWTMYASQKIEATLRRRRGVCENYASLFTDIAIKCGFPSFVVSGYTKQSGMVDLAGHSWCAVLFQKQWWLCDPTWDAGLASKTTYFLIPPKEFIQTHMPFDPLWQLLEYPLSDQEFRKGILNNKKGRPVFSVMDSLQLFLQQDSLHQLESSVSRIRMGNVENERVSNWLAYNQMKISIVYGEQDMGIYNEAVKQLNKATGIFNHFIAYRNNQFVPILPDKQIKSMLEPATVLLTSATAHLSKLGSGSENFQYDPGTLLNRIGLLKKRLEEQEDFIKRYLSASETNRMQLFAR